MGREPVGEEGHPLAIIERQAAPRVRQRDDPPQPPQTSIVDLLKLLDLDSSLDARKQLADELNVHAGADGSAEENIALHKAVMEKLAENGGVVPDSLRN